MKSVTTFAVLLLALQYLCGTELTEAKVHPFAIEGGPMNLADYVGAIVTLTCSSDTSSGQRVVWTEYATNPSGETISDNEIIVPSHPNAARYEIVHGTSTQYDLVIHNIVLADGGTYRCEDANSGPPTVQAELIVLESAPICNTTVGLNGIVMENQLHTAECFINFQGNLAPKMNWTGPSPFQVAEVPSEMSLWSGISFVVIRSMDGYRYECLTFFSDYAISEPPPEGSATNPPSFTSSHPFVVLDVNWGPKNMYIFPQQDNYQIGDVVTCQADASPAPSYQWQNMRTLDVIAAQSFTVTADFEGLTTTMRCIAQNVIQEVIYTGNLFTNITVLRPTTPPTTTPTPTTPTPTTPTSTTPTPTTPTSTTNTPTPTANATTATTPTLSTSTSTPLSTPSPTTASTSNTSNPTPQTDSTADLSTSDANGGSTTTADPDDLSCGDLTGRWQSNDPSATLCLEVIDYVRGEIYGLMRNGTDSTFVEIVGRATPEKFDIVGWSGLWPDNIFVASFVAECHRCDGDEVLIANPLSRTIRVSPACGVSGPIRQGETFEFFRQGPSCNETLLDVWKPTHISERLGIRV